MDDLEARKILTQTRVAVDVNDGRSYPEIAADLTDKGAIIVAGVTAVSETGRLQAINMTANVPQEPSSRYFVR